MKNTFTKGKFDKKLLSYSIVASAALLATNGVVKANVVVTTATGNTTVNSGNMNYGIDFDGNSKNEINLSYRTGFGGQLLVARPLATATATSAAFIGNHNGGFFYPYALNQSKGILTTPASGVWGHNGAAGTNASLNIGNYGGDHWDSVTDKYLGVRFKIGGNVHYGWVKISTTGASSMTISSYAYETATDTPIGAPLPVQLTSFTALLNNNSVNLNWKTATEVNNYGFEIQRTTPLPPPSEGGGDEVGGGSESKWVKIGFITGSGTSNSPKEYSFTDDKVTTGNYKYRLKQIDNDGRFEYSDEVEVNVTKAAADFALQQNYPNPFNPSTLINYTLPQEGHVVLKLYDILGKEVATLVDKQQSAGTHSFRLSSDGFNLAAGVYVYELQSGSFTDTKKMLLLK